MILVVFITIIVCHLKEVTLSQVILKHWESVEVYKVECEPAGRSGMENKSDLMDKGVHKNVCTAILEEY